MPPHPTFGHGRTSAIRRPAAEILETRALLTAFPNPAAVRVIPHIGTVRPLNTPPSVSLISLSGDVSNADQPNIGLVASGTGLAINGKIYPSPNGTSLKGITLQIEDTSNKVYGQLPISYTGASSPADFSIPLNLLTLPPGSETYHLAIVRGGANTDTFNNGASRLFFPTFTIAVDPGPTASPGSFSTNESTLTPFFAVAANTGGTSLTYSIATPPAHASTAFSIDPNTGLVSNTSLPDPGYPGYIGTDSFDFKVTDNFGRSATATVNVTVTPGITPSVVQDTLPFQTTQLMPISGKVSSIENHDGNPLTFFKDTDPLKGTLTFNADGTFQYTPDSSVVLTKDYSFTYHAHDAIDNLDSNEGTVVITSKAVPILIHVAQVSPSPRNTAVSTVDVIFSEPIDTASFNPSDLTLTRDGQNVVIGSGLSLSHIAGSAYRIGGLDALTSTGGVPISGSYVLSFNTSTILDLAGTAGVGSGSTSFSIDTSRPAVVSFGPISPSPRRTAVSSILVGFSKPIDPASLTASSLSLTLDGKTVPLGSVLTFTPVSGTTYQIGGLNNLTTAHRAPLSGSYVLTINASTIRDLVGNRGTGTTSASFVIDTIPAKVASFSAIVSPRATPVSGVSVSLTKPIDMKTVVIGDISLTRDDAKVPLTPGVAVVPTSTTSFQITGLDGLTGLGGTYVLTVSANFRDLLGNTGGGDFTTSWVVDHTPPVIVGIQNLTVEATSAAGAFVTFPTIIGSDSVDLNVPVIITPASGSFFPVGSTTVTSVSADKSGNIATATFLVNVVPGHFTPPTVAPTSFLATRTGIHQLVLTFSEPMNAFQAALSTNYQLARYVKARRGKGLTLQPLAIKLAAYDPATQTVTLSLSKTLPLRQTVQLLVQGANLTDIYGIALAGSPTGQAGTNLVVRLGPGTPVVRADLHPKVVKKAAAHAAITPRVVNARLAAKLSTG